MMPFLKTFLPKTISFQKFSHFTNVLFKLRSNRTSLSFFLPFSFKKQTQNALLRIPLFLPLSSSPHRRVIASHPFQMSTVRVNKPTSVNHEFAVKQKRWAINAAKELVVPGEDPSIIGRFSVVQLKSKVKCGGITLQNVVVLTLADGRCVSVLKSRAGDVNSSTGGWGMFSEFTNDELAAQLKSSKGTKFASECVCCLFCSVCLVDWLACVVLCSRRLCVDVSLTFPIHLLFKPSYEYLLFPSTDLLRKLKLQESDVPAPVVAEFSADEDETSEEEQEASEVEPAAQTQLEESDVEEEDEDEEDEDDGEFRTIEFNN